MYYSLFSCLVVACTISASLAQERYHREHPYTVISSVGTDGQDLVDMYMNNKKYAQAGGVTFDSSRKTMYFDNFGIYQAVLSHDHRSFATTEPTEVFFSETHRGAFSTWGKGPLSNSLIFYANATMYRWVPGSSRPVPLFRSSTTGVVNTIQVDSLGNIYYSYRQGEGQWYIYKVNSRGQNKVELFQYYRQIFGLQIDELTRRLYFSTFDVRSVIGYIPLDTPSPGQKFHEILKDAEITSIALDVKSNMLYYCRWGWRDILATKVPGGSSITQLITHTHLHPVGLYFDSLTNRLFISSHGRMHHQEAQQRMLLSNNNTVLL